MSQINFNLRISEEMNDELIRIAEKEGRSKNKQIEQILKEYIEKYIEAEEKKAKARETA
ncbi:MAG: Arc family DNA-binding protein [Ruminococcus sp.]|nr:Arc family DNA-binding protein [Ruminococcus sp.]